MAGSLLFAVVVEIVLDLLDLLLLGFAALQHVFQISLFFFEKSPLCQEIPHQTADVDFDVDVSVVVVNAIFVFDFG